MADHARFAAPYQNHQTCYRVTGTRRIPCTLLNLRSIALFCTTLNDHATVTQANGPNLVAPELPTGALCPIDLRSGSYQYPESWESEKLDLYTLP